MIIIKTSLKYAVIILGLGWILAATGSAEAADFNATERKVIDFMEGYWRSRYMFAPAPVNYAMLVRATSSKKTGLDTLIKKHKTDISKPSFKWPFYYSTSRYAGYFIRTPLPSPDWIKPDFDDSSWPRRLIPMLTWKNSRFDRVSQTEALCCFRARFLVKDPGQAAGLKLELVCRGGAVAYINGHEVGRTGLPLGQISPETPAEPYPDKAYVLDPLGFGRYPKRPRPIPDLWGKFPGPTVRGGIKNKNVKALADSLGIAPADITFYGHRSKPVPVTRKEFQTVKEMRNRRLGPVEIPVSRLRKGVNILAIEVHRSSMNPIILGVKGLGSNYWSSSNGDFRWTHAFLVDVNMTYRKPGVVSLPSRTHGIKVWTEDIHRRCFVRDFGPPENKIQPINLVGARSGVYSGQAVIDTGKDITHLRASVSALSGPRDSRIPASAVTILYGKEEPASDLVYLFLNGQGGGPLSQYYSRLALIRYVSGIYQPLRYKRGYKGALKLRKDLSTFFFYDHLSTEPPVMVKAGSCRPVWMSVQVPAHAVPGLYRGILTVNANTNRFRVPVRLQVMDWNVPRPQDFRTVMALEPSPYSVAAHYNADLWSKKHFSLMENTFRLLAKVGGDMLIIPVLARTEFANGTDSMIRWKRRNSGYSCDFSIMERYLDLALKHIKPLCVCFVVSHSWAPGTKGKKYCVVKKNGSDKAPLLEVPLPGTPEALDFWKPLVAGIRTCMEKRGLEKAWHWGYLGDIGRQNQSQFDPLFSIFDKLAPGVGWARGSHWGAGGRFSFATVVRMGGSPVTPSKKDKKLIANSHKGWRWFVTDRKGKKRKRFWLVLTRVESPAYWIYGMSNPFRFRLAPEHALITGAQGIGRWGADCWIDRGIFGWRNFNLKHGSIAMTVTWLLWPGPNGAESGTRFECLREGLQEAEARIYLEKKLEDKAFAESPAGKTAKAVLDKRVRQSCFYRIESSDNCPPARTDQYYPAFWQERCWDLYAAAAGAAGGNVPAGNEKKEFFGHK